MKKSVGYHLLILLLALTVTWTAQIRAAGERTHDPGQQTSTAKTTGIPAELLCPADGSVLPSTTYSFEWNPSVDPTITDCDLVIYDDSSNYYCDENIPVGDQWYTVEDLPADGRAIHVTLTSNYSGGGQDSVQYTFYAPGSLPPNPPVAPSPGDGATAAGADQTLTVIADDPNDGEQLQVTFHGRQLGYTLDDFTIAVIPDTQWLSCGREETIETMMQWVADSAEQLGIAYVAHVGDLVQCGDDTNNYSCTSQGNCQGDPNPLHEWITASGALSSLEGLATTLPAQYPKGMPYGVAIGNHDCKYRYLNTLGGITTIYSTDSYNSYLGTTHFTPMSVANGGYYGDHYPSSTNDNSYQLFEAQGLQFIAFTLKFENAGRALDSGVLPWVKSKIAEHPDRRIIVVFHYLLNSDGSPSSYQLSFINELQGYSNLFLMLCGHELGEAVRIDRPANPIYTLLANWQDSVCSGGKPFAGDGYLRLLRFSPWTNTIRVMTYSPTRDRFDTTPKNLFELAYSMGGPLSIGDSPADYTWTSPTYTVQSGDQVTTTWPGLEPNRAYEWYVETTDADGHTVASPKWHFYTVTSDPETSFQRIGEMVGGDPRTRVWGNRGVTNVLASGPIAVGRGSDGGEGSGFTAFRWQDGSFTGLPRAGSGPYSSHSWAYGISADGSVAYGHDLDAGAPVVWTDTGGGWLNANTITLNAGAGWGAISANGQVIVDTGSGVGYRFTTTDGWATPGGIVRTALSGLTAANGCSADGSVIVGTSASGPAIYNGPSAAGTVTLPGSGEAYAVSDDGTVVAGISPTNIYGKDEPCKWVYAGGSWSQTILPLLPGMVPEPNGKTGSAFAVSADGQRIAGHFREYGDYYIPLVWENDGVRSLESMLNDAGVFIESGWYLADLGAMSPDGKTFGGSMSNQPIGQADSNRHAWIATVGAGDGCGELSSGFETAAPWSFTSHPTWPASSQLRGTGGTADEHSGERALALSNQAYAAPVTNLISAGPGVHTISVYNRGAMSDSSYGGWLIRAYYYDSNQEPLSPAYENVAACTGNAGCVSTSWTERSGTVSAPSGTAFLKIQLYFYMADGWVAYDDLALDGTVLSIASHGVDGGFETDTGWTMTTSSAFPGTSIFRATWGTANEHSGSYGLALSNQAYAVPITNYLAAGPGNHTVSAWLRGEMDSTSLGGWIIRVWFYDSSKQALSPSWLNADACTGSAACLSTTWTQRSGTVSAPAGTAYLRIQLYLYMAGGWVAYDDVALDGAPLTVATHGVDGGFETDTGWTMSTQASFPGSSTYRGTGGTAAPHTGDYSLALSNQAYAYPSTDLFCAHPGTHQVSAWLRGELNESSNRGWIIRSRFYDSNQQQLSYQDVAACTSGSAACLSPTWTQQSGLVTAPAGTAFMKLQLYLFMANGWAAFDDVEVVRVD